MRSKASNNFFEPMPDNTEVREVYLNDYLVVPHRGNPSGRDADAGGRDGGVTMYRIRLDRDEAISEFRLENI